MRRLLLALLVLAHAEPAIAACREYIRQSAEHVVTHQRHWVCDTAAERPDGISQGDTVLGLDTLASYVWKDGAWSLIVGGEGGGAPVDAKYWVETSHVDLTQERRLDSLATGLLINTAGVPSAYAGTSCTDQFARSLNASGAATCATVTSADTSGTFPPSSHALDSHTGSVTDAQVPDNITVDMATTATTANAGDSATAFFSSGTLEVARGGTGAAPGADDQLLVSDSTSAATWRTLTTCTGAGKAVTYDAATNAFGCNSISGSSFALTIVEKDIGSTPLYSGSFDITGLSGLTPAAPVLVQQAAGPYTGKGDRQDEAEMDLVTATGYVVDANTIRVFWTSRGPVAGSVKFQYVTGG